MTPAALTARRSVVVCTLGITQTLVWSSTYYLTAVFADPVTAALHLSRAWFFGVFSAALLLSGLLGPLAGRMIDRFGGRDVLAATNLVFGSRDVWFVVGLPVFLYGFGWQYMQVAGFVAAWTIGYGAVQAVAPAVVTRSRDGLSREVPAARLWGAILPAIPVTLAILVAMPGLPRPDLVLVVGLLIFASPSR
jgi:MFS family permease